MLQLFMDKQFIPVLACVVTVFLILLIRPSVLVRGNTNKNCPYCLNTWLVTLVVLVVGSISYILINENAAKPQISVYS